MFIFFKQFSDVYITNVPIYLILYYKLLKEVKYCILSKIIKQQNYS